MKFVYEIKRLEGLVLEHVKVLTDLHTMLDEIFDGGGVWKLGEPAMCAMLTELATIHEDERDELIVKGSALKMLRDREAEAIRYEYRR
jgi:hypothetical protein